jgi:hypothetical protein
MKYGILLVKGFWFSGERVGFIITNSGYKVITDPDTPWEHDTDMYFKSSEIREIQ